jgi:hypothetical protein
MKKYLAAATFVLAAGTAHAETRTNDCAHLNGEAIGEGMSAAYSMLAHEEEVKAKISKLQNGVKPTNEQITADQSLAVALVKASVHNLDIKIMDQAWDALQKKLGK